MTITIICPDGQVLEGDRVCTTPVAPPATSNPCEGTQEPEGAAGICVTPSPPDPTVPVCEGACASADAVVAPFVLGAPIAAETVASVAVRPVASAVLPTTGSTSAPIVGSASLFLTVGVAAVFAARRRRIA